MKSIILCFSFVLACVAGTCVLFLLVMFEQAVECCIFLCAFGLEGNRSGPKQMFKLFFFPLGKKKVRCEASSTSVCVCRARNGAHFVDAHVDDACGCTLEGVFCSGLFHVLRVQAAEMSFVCRVDVCRKNYRTTTRWGALHVDGG